MKDALKIILSFLLLYGFFFLLIKVSQSIFNIEQEKKPNFGNVCDLNTGIYEEVCETGFNLGYSLINSLIEQSSTRCNLSYPTYNELYPICEPFYNNSSLTSSCLSGLQSGVEDALAQQSDHCADNVRDNQVAAVGATFTAVTGMFFHKASQTKAAKKVSDRVFCEKEKAETNALLLQ